LTVDVTECDFEKIFEIGTIDIVADAPPVSKLDPTDHAKGANSRGDEKILRIASVRSLVVHFFPATPLLSETDH
jgi:hypothetical protein